MLRFLHYSSRALLAVATITIGWFFIEVSIGRITYPYDIEWMEGGTLNHALRFRQALPIYATPTADWIPYIYPPFYPWLLSLLGEPSYFLGRGLSLFGIFAACGAGVWGLYKEGTHPILSAAFVGLFLSCYDDSGFFYDLVRNDSIALAFAAWSLVLTRRAQLLQVVWGGLFLFIAFTAKQSYALLGIPMITWLLIHGETPRRKRRLALGFGLASIVPALTYLAIWQMKTDEHLLTYLLDVPSAHRLLPYQGIVAQVELVGALIWVTLAASIYGVYRLRRVTGGTAAYWLMTAATVWILCTLMRAHEGGYKNVVMPGYWMLDFCVLRILAALEESRPHPLVSGYVSMLLCFQIWYGSRWETKDTTPTEADRTAGARIVAQIRAIEGEVWAPEFPWYPYLAGKRPSLPLIALWDIDMPGGIFHSEAKSIDRAIASKKWRAVLLSTRGFDYGLTEHYRLGRNTGLPKGAFSTLTGWPVQPRYFWFPRSDRTTTPLGQLPEH